MADRFGASSLTALLAVAGMVGLGVVGYKALNASPETGSVTPVANTEEVCPLMGGDCSMTCEEKAEKTACCSEGKEVVKTACCSEEGAEGGAAILAVAEETTEGATCSEAKECTEVKECKGLTDGCTGDGENGCCGGCAGEKTTAQPVSGEQTATGEKTGCCKAGS